MTDTLWTDGLMGGLGPLRRDNPWPRNNADIEPFYLSLDAGGRHIVTDLIARLNITLMVEVGSFLCGSTRQWLDASDNLVVIGIDPWDGNWSRYLRSLGEIGNRFMDTVPDLPGAIEALETHGNYTVALNNVRDFRDRFFPVRRFSPEALHYLHARRIHPELIYIDAFKSEEDLYVAHELFPKAILCGDDWTWKDESGRYQMREHVEQFAREKDFAIIADGSTWLLERRPET